MYCYKNITIFTNSEIIFFANAVYNINSLFVHKEKRATVLLVKLACLDMIIKYIFSNYGYSQLQKNKDL